jgi:anti-anti-sigma regulatory factor
MICKIDRHVVGEDLVVLRISGRVTGEAVSMLRVLLEHEDGALTIDLKDVQLVDGEAVRLLAILESNGTRIKDCPRYVREWITREREGSGSV